MLDYQDSFKLINKVSLSSFEVKVLTECYLPIIGVDSFSLYFTLLTLNEKENYLIKTLLDRLNLHQASDLNQSLSKLEALGLIKRYLNKDSQIRLEINKPLDYEMFFASPLLSEYLSGQIGLDEKEKIKNKNIQKSIQG